MNFLVCIDFLHQTFGLTPPLYLSVCSRLLPLFESYLLDVKQGGNPIIKGVFTNIATGTQRQYRRVG